MSDKEIESEIKALIKRSGYKQTKGLFCPVMRILSMRYRDVSQKQIAKAAKEIL